MNNKNNHEKGDCELLCCLNNFKDTKNNIWNNKNTLWIGYKY